MRFKLSVKIEKIEPIETAFDRLRQAPLEATDSPDKILIYQNAILRVREFHPNELNPISLYILKSHLESLHRLKRELFERYQIDIFRQTNILHLRTEEGQLIGMAPPLIEFYEETVQIKPLFGDNSPPLLSKKLNCRLSKTASTEFGWQEKKEYQSSVLSFPEH